MRNQVSEKQPSMRKTQSAQWAPEDEELRKGIDFINSQAPEGDALNEQTFWILSSIREQSGTPIEGWPESKVRGMAQNKSRGLAGAQPLSHYPLHTYSMKDFMSTVLLPLIYPLLLVHSIIMVGWPWVGETLALICMNLATAGTTSENLVPKCSRAGGGPRPYTISTSHSSARRGSLSRRPES